MSAHRFRALSEQLSPVAATSSAAMSPAFMPYPCSMLPACAPAQQSFIEEVYRIARERTNAQLQPPRVRTVQFSAN